MGKKGKLIIKIIWTILVVIIILGMLTSLAPFHLLT